MNHLDPHFGFPFLPNLDENWEKHNLIIGGRMRTEWLKRGASMLRRRLHLKMRIWGLILRISRQCTRRASISGTTGLIFWGLWVQMFLFGIWNFEFFWCLVWKWWLCVCVCVLWEMWMLMMIWWWLWDNFEEIIWMIRLLSTKWAFGLWIVLV